MQDANYLIASLIASLRYSKRRERKMNKEKPILFNRPMVLALLDGRKTQTRRIQKIDMKSAGRVEKHDGRTIAVDAMAWDRRWPVRTKYQVGDRLWVREAWRCEKVFDDTSPSSLPTGECVAAHYEADGARKFWKYPNLPAGRLRPSIHMPRRFSRITLEVTDVRVERLQDISEVDAKAEGALRDAFEYWTHGQTNPRQNISAKASFFELWESINGEGSWFSNPWVAAYTFKVLEK